MLKLQYEKMGVLSMIVKQYIKEFEKLGFGMFVHYGLYSILGSGEWTKKNNQVPDEIYNNLINEWNPAPDWAESWHLPL